jgi:hypothetical protein
MQWLRNVLGALIVLVIFGVGLFLGVIAPHFLKRGGVQMIGTSTIVQRVQAMSDLVTVKYVLEKVVILNAPPETTLGQFVQGDNRVLLLAHGIVKAGVDLKDLTVTDINVTGKTITLRLPTAHITDCYLDEDQTKVIDWKLGFLRAFDKDLEQTARKLAVEDIRHAARASGILRDASERAQWQLAALLHEAGYEHVNFIGDGAVTSPAKSVDGIVLPPHE